MLKRNFFLFTIMMLFFFLGCHKNPSLSDFNLVNNDKIIYETLFATIEPSFIRLKEHPKGDAMGVVTLFKDDIVKIVLVVNQNGGWCRAYTADCEGWIKVDELKIFKTAEDALAYISNQNKLTKK